MRDESRLGERCLMKCHSEERADSTRTSGDISDEGDWDWSEVDEERAEKRERWWGIRMKGLGFWCLRIL